MGTKGSQKTSIALVGRRRKLTQKLHRKGGLASATLSGLGRTKLERVKTTRPAISLGQDAKMGPTSQSISLNFSSLHSRLPPSATVCEEPIRPFQSAHSLLHTQT